ncbi:MAG: hypothetical protein EX341_06075 [Candidatus Scalindua sp. SCAELEC01]|nr:MAG: hypothetical protein EX341_06075 [Candidatus Scalindua sp. SCAELEC01]
MNENKCSRRMVDVTLDAITDHTRSQFCSESAKGPEKKITCRSCLSELLVGRAGISFSGHLRPLFTRSILAVTQATAAVLLDQINQI